MKDLVTKIKEIKSQAFEKIKKAQNQKGLENIWREFLGRKKGGLNNILKGIKDLPKDDRPKIGALANKVKSEIEREIQNKETDFKTQNQDENNDFDPTLPSESIDFGHFNPLTSVKREVEDIFSSMGYSIEQGPELEKDYYNFEALNIPEEHPARDSQDTFFVKDFSKLVMRTQTSAAQVRIMEKQDPPFRCIVPGRCFRNEATDASHEHTFFQVEGMVINENISVANLIYTLKSFLTAFFKKEAKVRLRPGFFPFTEPSFELDFGCPFCQGKGCSVCQKTGWIELIPCGMVHPNVLKAGGINSNKWKGFAFGLGMDRLAMLRYNIDDIRLFRKGDLRFIKQF